ncbi:hypothetical protein [Thiomonas sp.]
MANWLSKRFARAHLAGPGAGALGFPKGALAPREDLDLEPHVVVMGLVPHASEADARAYTTAWAEKYLDAPASAALYLRRFGTGYLYELQERGIGRRAWLPSVLAKLDEQAAAGEPQAVTIAGSRVLQAQRNQDRLGFVILPESAVHDRMQTTPGVRPDGPQLQPLRESSVRWLYAGATFLGIGLVTLFAGLTARLMVPGPIRPAVVAPQAVFSLPLGQWTHLVQLARQGDYVARLEYQDNTWQLIPAPLASPKALASLPGVHSSPRPTGLAQLPAVPADRPTPKIAGGRP